MGRGTGIKDLGVPVLEYTTLVSLLISSIQVPRGYGLLVSGTSSQCEERNTPPSLIFLGKLKTDGEMGQACSCQARNIVHFEG